MHANRGGTFSQYLSDEIQDQIKQIASGLATKTALIVGGMPMASL